MQPPRSTPPSDASVQPRDETEQAGVDLLSTEPHERGVDDDPSASGQREAAAERGSRLGRYVLLDRIGAGGMGVVHAAWDPELDRRVAIKLISDRRPALHGQLRLRLRREAQAMARLHHPNVVQVYDAGEADGHLFVAMEYVDGPSLRRWLHGRARTGPAILAAFRRAGEGLAAAHASGIVHRDFKPDNVLVAKDDRVLVLDFGLASWVSSPGSGADEDAPDELHTSGRRGDTPVDDDGSPRPARAIEIDLGQLTATGAVLGTPAYMAPEQRRGRPIDARSDQYSFCAALWEALSGGLPFGRGELVLARARTGQFSAFERRDVPASVERALRRGLAWHADQRWPDMRALLDALEPPVARRRWVVAVPAAAAGLVALAVTLAVQKTNREPSRATVDVCEDGRERVTATWNPSSADALGREFVARGRLADQTWPYLRTEIDRWTKRWLAADTELCQRYRRFSALDGGAHLQQVACLDRQLSHLELLLELLATVSEDEISKSFDLLETLPSPQHCRDAGDDAPQRTPTSVDPAELAALDRAIARVELEHQLSRRDSVDEASERLLAQTAAPGLEAQHRRIAALRAGVLVDTQRGQAAVDAALSGLEAAERSGLASLRLLALLDVAHMFALVQDPISAERWLRPARALAAELELDRETRAKLATTEAMIALTDGRFAEALVGWDQALAATLPEQERFEYIDRLHHRATTLFMADAATEGLEVLRRCVTLYEGLVGPNHEGLLQLRLDIAHAMEKAGELVEARAAFLAVASDIEAARGGPTTYSLAARGHAAGIRDQLGDCEGALDELEPVVATSAELMAYPSPLLGNMLRRRARLCAFATPDAVAYAERTLALYREALTDEHAATAASYTDLSHALLVAGELERARVEVGRALEIYAALDPDAAEFGPHIRTAEAVATLVHHALGQPGALDGAAALLAALPKESQLTSRLAAIVALAEGSPPPERAAAQ